MQNREWSSWRTRLAPRRHFRIVEIRDGGSESDQTECLSSAGGEIPTGFGDVFYASEAHDAHGQFAQGRHHMGTVLGADLGEVLVESHVADMMVTVFNLPMTTGDAQQVFRGGSFFAHAGETEGAIITDLATFQVGGYALNPEGLTQMWEIYAGCPGGDGNFTVFITAMPDISRFGAEGGNPPRGGRSERCGVFADSP